MILLLGSELASLELLSNQLVKEGYETLIASSMEELDQALREREEITLAVIDLSGFDQRIWERCEKFHKSKVPFIIISPQRSPTVQRDSMKLGAGSLLVKPVSIKELLEHIHTLLGE